MTRRARGEGTVVRDGDGWVARIELPPGPDGKRRRRKRRARTKSAAHEALKQLQQEHDEALNPDGASRTVAEAVAQFMEIQPTASRAAHTIYLEVWRASMIVSALGRRKLGQLTVRECDAFLQDVADGSFGSRTINRDGVRRTRSLFVRVLKNEMRTGNLARNVADLSIMPTFPEPTGRNDDEDGENIDDSRRSLTYEEFQRFKSMARQPMLTVIELCGRNGLRPSEARGLRWQCIGLDDLSLTVNRQMSSRDTLTGPKTKRARRTISIDAQTAACLHHWQQQQEETRRQVDDLWRGRDDLVITTRFGTPINRNNLLRSVATISEKAGIDPIVPYELRHTAITFQVDAGHEKWRVADWAGTSERMIEEVYRHKLGRIAELGPVARDRRAL